MGDDGAGEDEYGDYYDEEADYGEEEDAEESDADTAAVDSTEINAKLRKKYGFLWKTREEMTASERRWKWVKKESLPEELVKIMDLLKGGKK